MRIADHMPKDEQQPAGPPPARGGLPNKEAKAAPKEQGKGGDVQAAHEQIVLLASDILYSEETMPDVLSMLQAGADDPAKAIADTAVFVVGQLDDASGGTIPEENIIPAVEEVAGEVASLAQAKGIFQVDQTVLGRAAQHAVIAIADMYGEPGDGEIQEIFGSVSEEERQRIAQEQSQYSVV